MTDPTPSVLGETDYQSLKSFYADHMQTRDRGDTEAWLAAFPEDATLTTNVFDQDDNPTKAAFAPDVRALDRRFAEHGVQRRHWLGNFVFTRADADTVRASYYAVLLTSPPGGPSTVHSTSAARDVLRRTPTGWTVLSRVVSRDDLRPL